MSTEGGGCVCGGRAFFFLYRSGAWWWEKGTAAPFLEPVLTYQMILPEGADTTKVLRELKQLEEEEPLLNIVWNPALEKFMCSYGRGADGNFENNDCRTFSS